MESATQAFLEIQDIREGVLLLKNNSIRGVLMVSSINFALKLEERQTNTLLREQTASYIEFIKNMVVGDMIMTKNFYVVVPYNLMEIFGMKGMSKQFDFLKKFSGPQPTNQLLKEDDFQRCKTQLWQRMEYLSMGLRRCGLEAVPLTTPELIELFWSIHHPDQAEIGYYPEILPELLKS